MTTKQNKTNKTETTPSQVTTKVEENREQVLAQLAQLTQLVRAYGTGEALHWGHVGSLAHVRSELRDVLGFMGYRQDVAQRIS